MTYSDTLRAEGLLTLAPASTPCQGSGLPGDRPNACEGNQGKPADAVHTWEGRHYCAYHSPFDAWAEAPEAEVARFEAVQELAERRHDSDAAMEAFTSAVMAMPLEECRAYGAYRRTLREG
jgi:hypothetical protein